MIKKYFTVWPLLVILSLSYLVLVYNRNYLKPKDTDIFNNTCVLADSLIKVNFDGVNILVCADSIFNQCYKIMSYFDIGCGKCLFNLNVIDRYFNEIEDNDQASFFHIGINNNSDLFMLKYIASHNRINLKNPVYIF